MATRQTELPSSRAASAARSTVVTVERRRRIAAPADAVFAAMSDPRALATILPRVKKVELLQQGPANARVATHMQVGPFTTVRSEGDVRWQDNREVVFSSTHPISVESRFAFQPVEGGTELHATLTIDLAPMLGPLAAMVPQENVAGMIAPDLDQALGAIARRCERK